MTDTLTTSYQSSQLYSPIVTKDRTYDKLPDQFTRYQNKIYNPIDFFTSSGEFNLSLFNKVFREEQLKRMAFYKQQEIARLNKLNYETPETLPLDKMSVGEHLLNMKKSIFDIWYDLQSKPIDSKLITKNNRMFYVGLFIVVIIIIWLILKQLAK
jgi:hypothetical protein